MVRRVDTQARRHFPLLDGRFAMSSEDNGEQPGHAPKRGQIRVEDRAAIRQRSADIGKQLDAVKARRAEADARANSQRQSAFGQAFRYAAELIVGVAVGGFLGWALDRQFGTAPWLMIVLVVFGFAAGLFNVIRAAKKAQAENEALQRSAPSVSDDDDVDDR